jgi:hypothetical protein
MPEHKETAEFRKFTLFGSLEQILQRLKPLLYVMGALFIIGFGVVTYFQGRRITESGFVDRMTELPYLGPHLASFPASGKIYYHYDIFYRNSFIYVVCGKAASLALVKDFCKTHNLECEADYPEGWTDLVKDLKRVNPDLSQCILDYQAGDYSITGYGKTFTTFMSYRPKDGKFTMYLYGNKMPSFHRVFLPE